MFVGVSQKKLENYWDLQFFKQPHKLEKHDSSSQIDWKVAGWCDGRSCDMIIFYTEMETSLQNN